MRQLPGKQRREKIAHLMKRVPSNINDPQGGVTVLKLAREYNVQEKAELMKAPPKVQFHI